MYVNAARCGAGVGTAWPSEQAFAGIRLLSVDMQFGSFLSCNYLDSSTVILCVSDVVWLFPTKAPQAAATLAALQCLVVA
jgi:hypothetical protein